MSSYHGPETEPGRTQQLQGVSMWLGGIEEPWRVFSSGISLNHLSGLNRCLSFAPSLGGIDTTVISCLSVMIRACGVQHTSTGARKKLLDGFAFNYGIFPIFNRWYDGIALNRCWLGLAMTCRNVLFTARSLGTVWLWLGLVSVAGMP